MVFLSYWNFAKAHGPQLNFVEALMRARDDLDKADVQAIMESARRKVKQEGMPEVPPGGITVVGRVEQAHAQGGFFGMGTKKMAGPGGMALGAGGPGQGASADGSAGGGWSALAASANFLGSQWRGAADKSAIPPVSASH